MSNEKEIKSPYFRYCEIFGSCLNSDIRIFPFFPLTSQVQDNVDNNIDTRNTLDNNMGTKNTPSIIPFELPFP